MIVNWTEQELADVVAMTTDEFMELYPHRSRKAVHQKRSDMKHRGFQPVQEPSRPFPRRPAPVSMPEMPLPLTEDELWNAALTQQRLYQRQEESTTVFDARIKISATRPIGIVFMSDFHLGGAGVDMDALRRDIDIITGAGADLLKVFVGGDGIDNFVISGLSHVHRDTALFNPQTQMALFRKVIERLLPQLLAVGTGNHDGWTKRVAGIDANLAALAGLPVLHTQEDCYLTLAVGMQEYVIWRKHRPPTSSKNNPTAGVQAHFRNGDRPFDVGVTEHHHTPNISSFYGHGRQRWAITTGSYKIADAHAREFGHVNGGVGTPVIVLHPLEHLVVPFLDLPSAIDFLQGL